MACLKDKITIAQLETMPNIWNGSMFGELDWFINALRRFVSISWACYPRDNIVSAVYATATLLAGWMSVTCQYCNKTAKPILTFFWLSGSPIILVSSDPCADTQFQREPLQWGNKYTGWEKLAIFDGSRRLSKKRCKISRWLLWNINRKSWVPNWKV